MLCPSPVGLCSGCSSSPLLTCFPCLSVNPVHTAQLLWELSPCPGCCGAVHGGSAPPWCPHRLQGNPCSSPQSWNPPHLLVQPRCSKWLSSSHSSSCCSSHFPSCFPLTAGQVCPFSHTPTIPVPRIIFKCTLGKMKHRLTSGIQPND